MTRPALLLVVALAGCSTAASAPLGPQGPQGPVTLTPIDGPGLLAAARARRAPLTLVNVWATWCAPCVAELPDLIRVGREYAPRGLALVLVSTDAPEAYPAAEALLTELQAPLPSYVRVGPDAAFIEALHPEWNGTLPATFLYAPDGACVGSWEGPLDYDSLTQVLAAAEWSSPKELEP